MRHVLTIFLMLCSPALFAQRIINISQVVKHPLEKLVALDQEGRVAGVANEVPAISEDGGVTWKNILTPDELLLLSGIAVMRSDAMSHSIITGKRDVRKAFQSTNAGMSWEQFDLGVAMSDFAVFAGSGMISDGSVLDGMNVSADFGRTWRSIVIPDSVQINGNQGFNWGHSYGRGTLFRPGIEQWYCIDHTTGTMQERPDIPQKAFYAEELANGYRMVGFYDKTSPRIMICPPGEPCFSIDSVAPGVTLKSKMIRQFVHYNEYAIADFNGGTFAVVLGPTGHRTINTATLVAEDPSIRSIACNSYGVALVTGKHCVFIAHDGSDTTIIPASLPLSSDNVLVGRRLIGQSGDAPLYAVDFEEGTIRCVGQRADSTEQFGEWRRFTEVLPTTVQPYAYMEGRYTVRIDTANKAPFQWIESGMGTTQPTLLNPFELPSRAQRRSDAELGCAALWSIAPTITATGGEYGLRITNHNNNAVVKYTADTVTTLTSIDNGATIVAGHRTLMTSKDSGATWQPMEVPDVGSVISAYALAGSTQLIGYRGFAITENTEERTPIAGGVYRNNGSGWSAVTSLSDNYVYNLTVDNNGVIWAVTTTATKDYTTDVTETDTTITQIDVTQGNINVYKSDNQGQTWQLVHAEPIDDDFHPITGVVSDGSGIHAVALPDKLLIIPDNGSTVHSISIFPFGTTLHSARIDSVGMIWVAASNGVYVVDPQAPTSVAMSDDNDATKMSVWPHPLTSATDAYVNCPTCTTQVYTVFDMIGQPVATLRSPQIPARLLGPGLYVIRNEQEAVSVVVTCY